MTSPAIANRRECSPRENEGVKNAYVLARRRRALPGGRAQHGGMKTRALTTTNTPAAAIRKRLAQLGPRDVGKRFPEAIRREVLAYLAAQRERGDGA